MGTPPTGKDEFYIYDGLDRLIKANRGNLSSGTITDANAAFSQAWAAWDTDHWASRLDALGNWPVFKQDDNGGGSGDAGWELSQTRLHNKVNEIDNDDNHANAPSGSISGGSWILPVHDAAGNMTSGPKPGAETTRIHMKYDAWNRMVEVRNDSGGNPGSLIITCRYDGANRRIQKIVAGSPDVTYDYYYSGYQVVEVRKDGDTDPYEQYVWDIRYVHSPVLRWRDTTSPPDGNVDETLYYTNDANFNVTALMETDGDVVERVVYDPYGKATFYDGSWANPSSTSAYANDVLYTGHRLDPETGLYHTPYRPYHPTLGRPIVRDLGGYVDGMSLYEYVASSPLVYTDWAGLQIGPELGAGMSKVAEERRKKSAAAGVDAQQTQGTGQRGFTRAPSPQAQTPNRLDVMQDLKNALDKLCECFKYDIDPKTGRLSINSNPVYGDPPSEKFCCCYYKNLPGCNLVLMFRDAPKPDVQVQPGANVSRSGVMGVGDSRNDDGSINQKGIGTTAHEMTHVVGEFPLTQEFAVDAATDLIGTTPGAFSGTGGQNSAEAKKFLGKLVKNRYPDCQGKVTPGAQKSYDDFQTKAQRIMDAMK